ncbi:MAG: hypothetical protein EHM79_10030 [Geobacter sp.]|nr:MAG: hypothetical protein EHM79_10030 [Geobacter sp.]
MLKQQAPAWEHDYEAFDKKCEEWKQRDWVAWLNDNLSFPFEVRRVEDEDDAYFTDIADKEPFRLGHIFTVLKAELDDDLYGVIVKVSEGRRRGHVPLCDVEVANKNDSNYWPVREYAVWFANRY